MFHAAVDAKPRLDEMPKLEKGGYGGYEFERMAYTRTVLSDTGRLLYWGGNCTDKFLEKEDFTFTMFVSLEGEEKGNQYFRKLVDENAERELDELPYLVYPPWPLQRANQIMLLHKNARNGIVDGSIQLTFDDDQIMVKYLSTFQNSGGVAIALMRTSEKIAQLMGYDVLVVFNSVEDKFYQKLGYLRPKNYYHLVIPVQDVVVRIKDTGDIIKRIPLEDWLKNPKAESYIDNQKRDRDEEGDTDENTKRARIGNGVVESSASDIDCLVGDLLRLSFLEETFTKSGSASVQKETDLPIYNGTEDDPETDEDEDEETNRTLALLVPRLNAGEIIPDEDLEGLKLKTMNGEWSEKISDLLVASAGKPGQGILTRIDPEVFKTPYWFRLYMYYGLFPVKGKFDFEHAINSLMILMQRMQSGTILRELNSDVFLIFLGFWLYHGEGKYGGELYNACKEKLRVMTVRQNLRYREPMFWSATQEQWDLFMKFKFPTVEVRSVPIDLIDYLGEKITRLTFAPLYITKETIKRLAAPKIDGYNDLLMTFKTTRVTRMYPDGGGEAQPKVSIKDFFDATNEMVEWSADDADSLRRITATFAILRKWLSMENDFNPKALEWLSKTYFVKSLSPNSVKFGRGENWFGFSKVTRLFLIAITPGIMEKVKDDEYRRLLESTQEETREQILGTVYGMHGGFPNTVISRVVMGSLPWERVYIGVGGKREHGKMADAVYTYIGGVIDSIERIKAEKYEKGEADKKRVRTTRAGEEAFPPSERVLIEKFKTVFKLTVTE